MPHIGKLESENNLIEHIQLVIGEQPQQILSEISNIRNSVRRKIHLILPTLFLFHISRFKSEENGKHYLKNVS